MLDLFRNADVKDGKDIRQWQNGLHLLSRNGSLSLSLHMATNEKAGEAGRVCAKLIEET